MNLQSIKTFATSKFARQVLVTQKHSPKILFVAGTIGVVGTVVLACRATLKTSEVLDRHELHQKNIENGRDVGNMDDEKATKNLHKLQIKTASEIVKLYLLPTALGVASIGALTGSHVILTKRNTAAMALYAGLDRAYQEYRQRVTSEYGADVDKKMSGFGFEAVAVEEKMADGTTKTTIKTKLSENGGSPYGVLFDEKSKHHSREPGRNPHTLAMLQNWANDKLRARGHLFLNEVLDMLDLPRLPAGQIVGWVFDPNNENHKGDNYVTFGIGDLDDETYETFLDGHEKNVWLDFNVDGPVFELI